jgi:hypothetical protein
VSGTVAEEAFRPVGGQVIDIVRPSPRLIGFSPSDLLSVAPVQGGSENP